MALVALAAVGASCGSASGTASDQVVARVGDLEIIHPFLPEPASPSVAAVYLTVRDTGATPDQLISISTPTARTSLLMAEDPDGSMSPLADLAIPARGEVSLAPGHNHLMLENPTFAFKIGQEVTATLTFARAGSVTIDVPVVPLGDIIGANDGSQMKGMPGM